MEIYEKHSKPSKSEPVVSSKAKYWAAIYIWFGLGVLLSGIVGFALPYILEAFTTTIEAYANAYLGLIIGSAIVVFPLIIILQVGAFKNKSILTTVCYIIYTIAFGILISSALSFAGAELSLYALLITGGVMALMGVAGVLLKDKLGRIGMIASSLFLGAMIISLVNFFFFNETVYWIASFAMLIAIILMVAFDIGRIKRTIDSAVYNGGEVGNSVLVYCAFLLYTDFMYIFLRILRILAATKNN